MQLLYAMEIAGATAGEVLPGVLARQPIADDQKKDGMNLVDLVQAHREELDEDIRSASVHWEIDRMAKIDRIVIRIAMVELLYVPDVPTKVAVSEAVQIATKFSTDNSGTFVNGLLAGFMQKHEIVTKPTKKES